MGAAFHETETSNKMRWNFW